MASKSTPFTKEQLDTIAEKYPTPFHIYDEKAIRENARSLKQAFSWNEGFKEFFAVKAAPNPYLMKVLKAEISGGAPLSQVAREVARQSGWPRRQIYQRLTELQQK